MGCEYRLSQWYNAGNKGCNKHIHLIQVTTVLEFAELCNMHMSKSVEHYAFLVHVWEMLIIIHALFK